MSENKSLEMLPKQGSEKGGSGKAWKWTKVKRKAVKLVVEGRSDPQIARELNKHRMTIYRWRNTPEFFQECIKVAREDTMRRRFKRAHEMGVLTDTISAQYVRGMQRIQKTDIDDLTAFDLHFFQSMGRELRCNHEIERSNWGDNVQRVEGNFNIGVSGLTGRASEIGAQSFKEFVVDNEGKVPQRTVLSGSDTEKLIERTRQLLLETEVLDDMQRAQEDEDES